MSSSTDTTHDQLIDEMHIVWSELRDAAYALTDEQIDRENTVGAWSGRDVMIHIANWEERCAEVIQTLDCGDTVQRLYTTDEELDALNERWVRLWHSVPLADAKAYFESAHQMLQNTIRASPTVRRDLVLGCYPGHLDDLNRLKDL
ncbi:MAG TPA: maleylpyruvate isomerase N-terminal domain-containing protein [Thermomicrobiales bacterium]|nr:maleylpyruvate isomerase N-terminal domain-containing protein [Thermomicrobiales bacterium]